MADGPVSVDPIINNNSFSTGTITNRTGAGTSPIVISTSSTAGLTDGRVVTITGASNPSANGTFVIANVIANTSFELVGTTGVGSAGGGGTWLTGGAVTFTADTVTGTGGTISAATAYRSVDIRNSLNRPLVLNGINVVTPSATPTVFINATHWQTFAFTVGSDVAPTEITIDSQGATSDIRLNAPSVLPGTDQGFAIYNPLGTKKINAAQGSILNAGGTPQLPTVWTRALDLQAAGSVGTSSSRLNVDLVRTSGQTGLDIEAGNQRPPSLGRRRSREFRIRSSNQAAGAVIALAKNGVYLTETAGDLNIDQVLSRISDVVLIAQSGSMLEAGDDAQADIQGRNIDLIATSAGSRIGSAGNPLEFLGAGTGQRPNDGFQIEQFAPGAGRLVAQADAGVYLTQTSGAVQVLEIKTPTGDVVLAVHDSVLAGEDLNLLQSGGQTFLGAILGTAPLAYGRILALTGSVTASAGDDFNLPTGTLIQGGSAAGINAPTTLTGQAGNDRFFIQAVPAPMTIDGGDGANRYYISSNAARSLFVTDGVFDDRGDDLAFPFSEDHLSSGTLENITAALTINTGDGGNGGSRDAIYVSAAGSTTALTDGLVTASQVTGLGNSGSIHYTTTAEGGVSLLLKLGAFDDPLQVTGAGANTQILVYGGDGNDTVNVGNAGDPLSEVSGIVAFFGEGGSGDTLNVYGVAAAPAPGEVNPNQLTAIAVTGLGSLTNKLVATHNDLFGAGYTIKAITLGSSSLEAAQLSLDNIAELASQLQNPTRNIDTYVANRLSVATRNALFDYQTGAEVVYRVNTPGTTPIVGLTDDTVYFVSGADSTAVSLVVSLDDLSNAIAVPRSSIGETNQVTLAHLDSGNRVVVHVSPTSTFAGNETITDNKIVFAGNHNLTTGQAVVYHIGSGNAPLGGLTDGGVYYVINVDDASIQLASSLANAQSDPPVPVSLLSPSDGTPDTLAPLASVSFDPSSVNANQIVFAGNHDLVDLQEVIYRAGEGNTPISPLAEGQPVWVIYIDATTVQLASSLPNAQSKTVIAINPAGSAGGRHTLTPAASAVSFDPSSLNVRDDQITFATDHNLTDGQQVIYQTGIGNTPIGGLIAGPRYYVETVDATTIRLNTLLTDGTKAVIHLDSQMTATLLPVVTTPLSDLLAEDLNDLISGPLVYDAQRFAGVALRPETSQLLSQYPQGNSVLNRLLLEDAYPLGLPRIPSVAPELPAAVYYAQRFINRAGDETIRSTVEHVNVQLAGTDNAFQVDSTFGGHTSVAGGTNTTVTLSSSLSGLHPATPKRVTFIDGTVSLSAANIVVDDSGNDARTTGTLEMDQVTGLMPPTVTFLGTPSTTIKLGANDDTFYVPATAAGQSVRLETGGGYDTVYVGTRFGAETTGTLSGLLGSLFIDGGEVLTGVDTLFLNDQDTTTPQSYTVTNNYAWYGPNPILDTTTITRNGTVIVQYAREETVALSWGQGGNTIDIQQTHREQSTDGSTSSTFTVNTGSGDDSITLGAPVGTSGLFSMAGFQQDVVAPTFTGPAPSPRGIPVLINSQGGDDTVAIRDTASTAPTSLAFTRTQFRDLFPAAPDAIVDSVDVFNAVFGDNALARPFTTVVLAQDEQRPINISIRESLNQALRLPGHNLLLTVSLGDGGVQGNVVQLTSAAYESDILVHAGDGNDTFNVENGVRMTNGHTLVLDGGDGDDTTYVDFNGVSVIDRGHLAQTVTRVTFSRDDADSGIPGRVPLLPGTYYVQTQWDAANANWQFRVWNNTANTAVEVANLGSTGPSFTADWQNIREVTAESDGRRVFPSGTGLVIEFGVEYQSGSVSTGGAAELLLGVPAAQVALTFHGGEQTADGMGDTLRIAGDGHATGAVYQPISSVPGGGTVTISGNSLAFSGVEPLIVHGLPDFKMLTPDLAADLIIDSAQLADVARQQLQLHTLTVEGQVTWTQKKQFVLENPALDPRQLGRAIAVSDDGLTMIVGANATAGGATAGDLPAVTLASLYAEKLPLANPSSMTVYDPTSRTLFVSDRIANTVYTYVNEGLYWRSSTALAGWISGKTAGFGIDMDLDAVNGRLAVGTTAD